MQSIRAVPTQPTVLKVKGSTKSERKAKLASRQEAVDTRIKRNEGLFKPRHGKTFLDMNSRTGKAQIMLLKAKIDQVDVPGVKARSYNEPGAVKKFFSGLVSSDTKTRNQTWGKLGMGILKGSGSILAGLGKLVGTTLSLTLNVLALPVSQGYRLYETLSGNDTQNWKKVHSAIDVVFNAPGKGLAALTGDKSLEFKTTFGDIGEVINNKLDLYKEVRQLNKLAALNDDQAIRITESLSSAQQDVSEIEGKITLHEAQHIHHHVNDRKKIEVDVQTRFHVDVKALSTELASSGLEVGPFLESKGVSRDSIPGLSKQMTKYQGVLQKLHTAENNGDYQHLKNELMHANQRVKALSQELTLIETRANKLKVLAKTLSTETTLETFTNVMSYSKVGANSVNIMASGSEASMMGSSMDSYVQLVTDSTTGSGDALLGSGWMGGIGMVGGLCYFGAEAVDTYKTAKAMKKSSSRREKIEVAFKFHEMSPEDRGKSLDSDRASLQQLQTDRQFAFVGISGLAKVDPGLVSLHADKIKSIQSDIDGKMADIRETSADIQKAKLAGNDKKVIKLEKKLEKLKREKITLEKGYNGLIDHLDSKINETNQELKKQIDLKVEAQSSGGDISAFDNKIKALRGQLENLNNDRIDILVKKSKVDTKLSKMQDTIELKEHIQEQGGLSATEKAVLYQLDNRVDTKLKVSKLFRSTIGMAAGVTTFLGGMVVAGLIGAAVLGTALTPVGWALGIGAAVGLVGVGIYCAHKGMARQAKALQSEQNNAQLKAKQSVLNNQLINIDHQIDWARTKLEHIETVGPKASDTLKQLKSLEDKMMRKEPIDVNLNDFAFVPLLQDKLKRYMDNQQEIPDVFFENLHDYFETATVDTKKMGSDYQILEQARSKGGEHLKAALRDIKVNVQELTVQKLEVKMSLKTLEQYEEDSTLQMLANSPEVAKQALMDGISAGDKTMKYIASNIIGVDPSAISSGQADELIKSLGMRKVEMAFSMDPSI